MDTVVGNTGSSNMLGVDPLLRDIPLIEGYKVLGGVVLYEKIGQGGMGAVYRGYHLRLDIDVAMKILMPQTSRKDKALNVERFTREAKMAAGVTHQNLVGVSDVNSFGDIHYLVMDYVDGESAGDRLDRKGALDEPEAVKIILGAARGLAAAHEAGIIHRDIKPDNILIDKKGGVRVTDLGLAKIVSPDVSPSAATQTRTGIGTPAYMPPEQFSAARHATSQADVWSLGVTLFVLLTNELPWYDESVFALARIIEKEPLPDPNIYNQDVTEPLIEILNRAVAKNPEERYANGHEFAQALEKHLQSIAPPPGPSLAHSQNQGNSKILFQAPPNQKQLKHIKIAVTTPSVSTAMDSDNRLSPSVGKKTASKKLLLIAATLLALLGIGILAYNFSSSSNPLNLTPEELAWLEAHPVITVGVDPSYAPFEYIDRKGKFSGMVAQYLKRFSKSISSELRVVPDLTWHEAFNKAANREIDILTCIAPSKRRRKLFLLSDPYLGYPRVIVTKRGSKLHTLADLHDKKVGVQKESAQDEMLREQTNIIPVRYPTDAECLLAVSKGEIDATIGNLAVSTYFIKKMAITNLVISGHVSDAIQPLSFGIRPDWPEFLSITNKFIHSIPETDVIHIQDQWIHVH